MRTDRAAWILAGLAICAGCGSGTAELSFGSAAFDFGTLTDGQSTPPQLFCLTNSGDGAATVALAGTSAFDVVTDECSTKSLDAGASCKVTVEAVPTARGPTDGTLTVNTDAAVLPLNVWVLDGSNLDATPAVIDFGRQPNGTARPTSPVTIANGGGAATGQLILAFDGQDIGDFELADDTCSNRALAGGARCTVSVRMRATSATVGPKRASLVASGLPGGAAVMTVLGVVAPTDGAALPCGI